MKITRRQLRQLIAEAAHEFRVKTVSDEQYEEDVASLPPSMQALATGQETSATIKKDKHRVGNFFMTKGVSYKTPRGYSGLKKFIDFYMILPDGEAILVNPPSLIIEKEAEGIRFLNLLNQNVTPLPLDSLENATEMQNQVQNVIAMMRQK
tara:strand:+ start:512 stop:964 length:453 start_codon:yes stop_codon:yes gene_type:complete